MNKMDDAKIGFYSRLMTECIEYISNTNEIPYPPYGKEFEIRIIFSKRQSGKIDFGFEFLQEGEAEC